MGAALLPPCMACPDTARGDLSLDKRFLDDDSHSECSTTSTGNSSYGFSESPPSMVMEFMDSPVARPNPTTRKVRIVVTRAPSTKQSSSTHHPYKIHKALNVLLVAGFIRIHFRCSLPVLLNQLNVTMITFKYFYFHYGDVQSQRCILKNKSKVRRCLRWIASNEVKDKNLAQFLGVALSSNIEDKIWDKMDTKRKGVIETHELVNAVLILVLLYQSTLQKGEQSNHEERKANGRDVEHLAVWMMKQYGQKQEDDAHYIALTKETFHSNLALYVQKYINTYRHLC